MEIKYRMSWAEAKERLNNLGIDKKENRIFGWPRGGAVVCGLLRNAQPVSSLQECNIILEDIVDTGQTLSLINKAMQAEGIPEIPVFALVDKRRTQDVDLGWIVFPWEREDEPTLDQTFAEVLTRYAKSIHPWFVQQGFWEEGDARNLGEILLLVVTEICEGYEGKRKGILHDEHVPEFSNLTIEIADAFIRLLDYAGHCDMDLGRAIIEKMKYNMTRPYKHGKKF